MCINLVNAHLQAKRVSEYIKDLEFANILIKIAYAMKRDTKHVQLDLHA